MQPQHSSFLLYSTGIFLSIFNHSTITLFTRFFDLSTSNFLRNTDLISEQLKRNHDQITNKIFVHLRHINSKVRLLLNFIFIVISMTDTTDFFQRIAIIRFLHQICQENFALTTSARFFYCKQQLL